MSELAWIVLGGAAMTSIALIGSVTLVLDPRVLERILLPLVGLAAGSLLGGAVFHLLPEGLAAGDGRAALVWLAVGFTSFFAFEHVIQRHHRHSVEAPAHAPVTHLVLLADALHNFLGGLAVAGAFLVDVRVGLTTWLVAAAHEIPQELGDFAVLVHGGWSPRRALLFNFLSASTFLAGGLLAYWASFSVDVGFLLPFAAGNFIYIAAADLIPETHGAATSSQGLASFAAFLLGVVLLYVLSLPM
jgi:zinc and cadmium transporter